MKARMEKYDEDGNIKQRTAKNENLYSEVQNMNIDYVDIDVDIFDCDNDISDILLCSDGLTNMLEMDNIERVLLSDYTTEDKVLRLMKKAINRGGTDNISIAYLDRSDKKEEEGRSE